MERKRNFELADIFYRMAEIYAYKNVRWKPQAYIIAAQTLESMKKNIEEVYIRGGEEAIEKLSGIGEGIGGKIVEFLKTGKISEYEKLKKGIPKGILDIMGLQGIGAKKARIFYERLGVRNLKDLERAAKSGKISKLTGFKKRSEEKILEAIGSIKNRKKKLPLGKALKISNRIRLWLKKIKGVGRVLVGGSIRRKKAKVGDIDIIVETSNPSKINKELENANFIKRIIGKGPRKASFITLEGVEVDLIYTIPEAYGACALHFTGDKQHNIWLRRIAIKKGMKLNEYGLFDKNGNRIAGETEREIYKSLGVKMVPPEKRIGEVKECTS